jgi:two-component system sensor histidine kinase PilS (NtrC family)
VVEQMMRAAEKPGSARDQRTTGSRKLRLVWVMLLRVGLISVLLGATIILNYRSDDPFAGPSTRLLLFLIAATYLGTIVYAFWYRSDKAIELLARFQLVLDLVFWACLTFATGGIVSGFTFLFDLWVIVSAIVLGGRAAFYSAAASVIILLGLTAAMSSGVLQPLSDQVAVDLSSREIYYFLVVNIAALFVVAGLVNSLVERLETAGMGLEEERKQRLDLAQLHADMIRSLTVGIATIDLNLEILMMNPAGRTILGLGNESIEGQAIERWLPDAANRDVPNASLLTRVNGIGIRFDGEHIPLEYIVAPLTGSDGARRGFIVVFSDLTEVLRLEAELERSRRLAALGELAASLAHEIRNPLGAVSGSFQMLARSAGLVEENSSLVDIISVEIRRMERLIGDMLEYVRPKQMNFSPVDIGKLADEVVRAFSMGQDSEDRLISTEIEPKADLTAKVDCSQIRQVLWNLLRNAAQATEAGDRIEISSREDRGLVIVEVRDTGRGIAEENLKSVFDPFFSTRELGLGLGLALCRRIVREHGGTIVAIPREKRGSIFRVTLPKDRGRAEGDIEV